MNIREKIIAENFEIVREEARHLSFTERPRVKALKASGIHTQEEFNELAGIAADLRERRGRRRHNQTLTYTFECPKCSRPVVWIRTWRDRKVLVDADSYSGEDLFDSKKHRKHWDNCDYCLPTKYVPHSTERIDP